MTSSSGGAVAARDAATVMVVRPGSGDGLEVLLVRRHAHSGFAAGAWVFPGGAVDPADARLPRQRWTGIEPAALAERFDADPELVLGLHVAAVRETFEEAGVLTEHRWLAPREALDRGADGSLRLMYPTATTLREMAGLASPEGLLHHAATRPAVRAVLPHVETGADGRPRILHPDDPGFPADLYPDVGRRRSR